MAEPDLVKLSKDVADAAAIDWSQYRMPDPKAQSTVNQLRVIAAIAAVHRTTDTDRPATPAPASLPHLPHVEGRRWGPLVIVKTIAEGSFGRVYRAHDPRLQRDVALKLLAGRGDRTDEELVSEARLLARIRHPNVVTVYGADIVGGEVGLWMELVAGQTLASWVASHGPLGPHEAAVIGATLCRAVAAVHGAALLHRDIKAQNVMRESGGRIVLMDFGAVRDQLGSAHLQSVVGTPIYLAPEILSGEGATVRSDLYSLGVLLFFMTTQRYPVAAADINELRTRHAESRQEHLRDLRPDLPQSFVDVVSRALAPDPKQRFESAGQLEEALLQTVRADAAVASVESRGTGPRTRFLTQAAVAAALVAATLGAVNLWRPFARRASDRRVALAMTALAVTPQAERNSRISPDGEWISYLAGRQGESRLWARRRDGFEAHAVIAADGVISSHVWSPDGLRFAYVLDRGADRVLQMVDAPRGSVPRDLIRFSGRAVLVKWAGEYLFVERGGGALSRVHVSSGSTVELTTDWGQSVRATRQYAVNAAGDTVIFVGNFNGQTDLGAIDIPSRALRRLTNDAFVEQYPVLGNPAGTSIYFQSTRSGQSDIWHLATDAGAITQITLSAEDEVPEDASDAAQLMTFRRESWQAELWSHAVASGRAVQLTQAMWDFSPSLAANGNTVVFQRRQPSLQTPFVFQETDLFVGRLTATSLESSAEPLARGFAPSVSPDGHWLAHVQRTAESGYALRVASVGSRTMTTITERFAFPGYLEPPLDLLGPPVTWAPDGHLYFVERDQQRVASIRRVGLDGGTPELLVQAARPGDHLRNVFVSADTRRLHYTADSRGVIEMHVFDLASATDRVLFRDNTGPTGYFFVAGYTHDGNQAIVLRGTTFNTDRSQPLDLLLVGTLGPPRRLTTLANAYGQTGRVAGEGIADGTLFLTMSESGIHNVYAVRLADGTARRISDNGREDVSYSALQPTASGGLLYARHEYLEDVWMLNLPTER